MGTDSSECQLIDAAWAQFEPVSTAASAPKRSINGFLSIPGYRVLGEIHRGGQGVVYQAIQESTHRKIAIKVLKQGPFADRTELARFEREVDVLSRLSHPHIVAIHDRGLTEGHAYYVMDYIAGQALDAYVAGAELDVRQVLDVFATVCEAVNVAHLRGVIHRDLKPGNIRIDLEGEPRILDFGLAKVEHEVVGGSSAQGMTITGQFIGSLPWASPEQADGRSDLLDIRTDVYSLGVILYQLLTTHFPYPVTGRVNDVVRHITHTSPAKPSSYAQKIDNELELILLKCLAKEPGQRYQSAGELAADIRRYLANEPITATSPSTKYRIHKFIQRNRGLVAAASAIAATLMIASTVSFVFGISEARQRHTAQLALTRAENAEREATHRADELAQVARFQQSQLAGIDARLMGVRLRQDLLNKARFAAERSKLSPDDINDRVAELEKSIAGADFTGLALNALDANFFKPALDAIEMQFADQPLVKAQLLQTLATTLLQVGLLNAAIDPQTEALAIRRRELGNEHPDTLTSLNNVANVCRELGRLDEAETLSREVLEKRRQILGNLDPSTLVSMNNLAVLLQTRGKLAEAEKYSHEALDSARVVLGEEHPDTLAMIDRVGTILHAQGRLEDAESFYRESLDKRRGILGADHPSTLRSLNNMAALLYAQGKLPEAEQYFRETLETDRRILGDDHPDTLTSINNLGHVLLAQEKFIEAEPFLRQALEKSRQTVGDDHPDTLASISNMGGLYLMQGNLAQAEPFFRESFERTHRVLGDNHAETVKAIGNMGRLLLAQGKSSEALELLANSETAARQTFAGGNAVRLARWLTALGRASAATTNFDAALANLNEASAIFDKAPGVTHRDRTDVATGFIELYDAWHTAEPEKGHDADAAKWRTTLDQAHPHTPATQPS